MKRMSSEAIRGKPSPRPFRANTIRVGRARSSVRNISTRSTTFRSSYIRPLESNGWKREKGRCNAIDRFPATDGRSDASSFDRQRANYPFQRSNVARVWQRVDVAIRLIRTESPNSAPCPPFAQFHPPLVFSPLSLLVASPTPPLPPIGQTAKL